MWFYLIIGIFFIAIGLAVHVFKWHFLIAGYNTMSEEKKAKVDTKGLGRLMGIYSYINGGVLILAGVLHALGYKISITTVLVVFGITTVSLLFKAQRYDGNVYDKSGKQGKVTWRPFSSSGTVTAITLIIVAVIMVFASQSTKVTFLDEGIKIHGMYGEVYKWESINDVKLMEELPTIERRTNGAAVGSNLKGYFRTTEYGSVKLFVNTQRPPFIYLETDDRITIFNTKNADETQEIFEEILSKAK